MIETILIGFYAAWFTLNVLRHWRPLRRLASQWDVCRLVPGWFLFTGSAVGPDLKLLVRMVQQDGSSSDWEHVPIWVPKPPAAYLWFPQLMARRIAADAVHRMSRASGLAGRHNVRRSFQYRSYLRFFSGRAAERSAVGLQFVVYGYREHDHPRRLEVVFLSDVHDLNGEALLDAV